jgi:hypothetical protein
MANNFSDRVKLSRGIPSKVQELLRSLSHDEANELWDWLDAAKTDAGALLQQFVENEVQ